jgi:hypothetical protein
MGYLKNERLNIQWRQDLLNLKESVKQKQFNTERALVIAQKIGEDYKNNCVKPDFDIQNAHIQLCDTLEQANRILAEYREDKVPLTTTTFNVLISLSPDLPTASLYFKKILELGFKPNPCTLNAIIAHCNSVQRGRDIIQSMNKYSIIPNTQTYNTLLSLSKNETEREEIINAMEDQFIEINIVTINTLISRAATYECAMNYYRNLKRESIKPTINTFITLLKKASRKQEINEIEQMLKKEGIKTNNNWENLLKTKNPYGNNDYSAR